jgi:hypothetical protein
VVAERALIFQQEGVGHMKPFITPEDLPGGKKLFGFQWEEVRRDDLRQMVGRTCLLKYCFPRGHSEEAAWPVFLIFDESSIFEISSAATQTADWDEIGSLNIRGVDPLTESLSKWDLVCHPVSEYFRIAAVERLIYEEESFRSECGLVFISEGGGIVTVAAGVSPGSVSILAPGASGNFLPQFPLLSCRRESV